jgi:putative phage-type endonuclease
MLSRLSRARRARRALRCASSRRETMHDDDPRTREPDFDDWRRAGITSSDAPRIIGASKYGDALDVYIAKVMPTAVEIPDSGVMRAGRALEEVAAREFANETSMRVQRVARREHPDRPWQRTHADRRVVGERAMLEIKTTSRSVFGEWSPTAAPQAVAAQLMHHLDCYDYDIGFAFALCRDTWERVVVRYEMTEPMRRELRDIEEQLWTQHIVPRVPPVTWKQTKIEAPRGEPTDAKVLALSGDIGFDFVVRMIALHEARGMKDEAEFVEKLAKANVEQFMQTHGFSAVECEALVDGVTRRLRYYLREQDGRRTLDGEAITRFVRAQHPEIDIEQFYKVGKPTTYSRDFWIKPTTTAVQA